MNTSSITLLILSIIVGIWAYYVSKKAKPHH